MQMMTPISIFRTLVAIVVSLAALMSTSPAVAGDTLYITDPSAVKFIVSDDRVYFRNLNEFDSTWLPCCYNYYLDLATDGGKAAFSTFLSYRLAGKKIMFYKTVWTTAGKLDIVGDF